MNVHYLCRDFDDSLKTVLELKHIRGGSLFVPLNNGVFFENYELCYKSHCEDGSWSDLKVAKSNLITDNSIHFEFEGGSAKFEKTEFVSNYKGNREHNDFSFPLQEIDCEDLDEIFEDKKVIFCGLPTKYYERDVDES